MGKLKDLTRIAKTITNIILKVLFKKIFPELMWNSQINRFYDQVYFQYPSYCITLYEILDEYFILKALRKPIANEPI